MGKVRGGGGGTGGAVSTQCQSTVPDRFPCNIYLIYPLQHTYPKPTYGVEAIVAMVIGLALVHKACDNIDWLGSIYRPLSTQAAI